MQSTWASCRVPAASSGLRAAVLLQLFVTVSFYMALVSCRQLNVVGDGAALSGTAAVSTTRASSMDMWSAEDKRPVLRAGVKYHLYDPKVFKMYSRCKHQSNAFDTSMKHSLDLLFIRKMIQEMGNSVPPEEAEMFVVPALMSQSARGRCGNHSENMRDLIETMGSSEWFRRRKGADHFIVADHFRTAGSQSLGQLPQDWKVVFAHFECSIEEINKLSRAQRLNVGYRSPRFATHQQQSSGCLAAGYSSYLALNKIGAVDSQSPPFKADKLPHQRRYDVFFVSGDITKHKHAYRTRKELVCSWAESSDVVKERFFFHLMADRPADCNGRSTWRAARRNPSPANGTVVISSKLKPSETMRVMADSRFFLQIHGDTITTDRLFNMFDTLTIPIVIDRELPHLLRQMPFNDGVVPWADLFVQIPSKEWKRNPAQSVVDAIDAVALADMDAKFHLLRQHAPDVSYAADDTRAHKNLLAAALKKMQANSARRL